MFGSTAIYKLYIGIENQKERQYKQRIDRMSSVYACFSGWKGCLQSLLFVPRDAPLLAADYVVRNHSIRRRGVFTRKEERM